MHAFLFSTSLFFSILSLYESHEFKSEYRKICIRITRDFYEKNHLCDTLNELFNAQICYDHLQSCLTREKTDILWNAFVNNEVIVAETIFLEKLTGSNLKAYLDEDGFSDVCICKKNEEYDPFSVFSMHQIEDYISNNRYFLISKEILNFTRYSSVIYFKVKRIGCFETNSFFVQTTEYYRESLNCASEIEVSELQKRIKRFGE